ncbi:unnamed protein product [Allacma fusca]|uniref:Uncharacterized protein n=1 Tax=Allacma fusca TaxID=39272 RepID=A0A8J2JNB1_9HEXA|nr:unnamed protein product [Allacma fusca]
MGKAFTDPLDIKRFLRTLAPTYFLMVTSMSNFVISFEYMEGFPGAITYLLPTYLQTNFIRLWIVVIHLIISFTRSFCWFFGLTFQAYYLSSIGVWMSMIANGTPGTYDDSMERMKIYRSLQLLVIHFNQRCLVTVLMTKISCTICGIFSLFILIKFGRDLDVPGILFTVWLMVVCVGMMPLLYEKLFRIRVFSLECQRQVLMGTDKIQNVKQRNEVKRMAISLPPTGIKCSNYYYLDQSFTPEFVSHVVEYTINLLLTF